MAREHRYQVGLRWSGAEHGPTSSYAAYSREFIVEVAGKPQLHGSSDPAFRGDPTLHNPEDWLVAALSSCHMLTYLAEAARSRLRVVAYEDTATGTMILEGNGGHFVEVQLRPRVVVEEGSDLVLALELHRKAHEYCFLARSMNFPVTHEAQVVVRGMTS